MSINIAITKERLIEIYEDAIKHIIYSFQQYESIFLVFSYMYEKDKITGDEFTFISNANTTTPEQINNPDAQIKILQEKIKRLNAINNQKPKQL